MVVFTLKKKCLKKTYIVYFNIFINLVTKFGHYSSIYITFEGETMTTTID